MMIGFSSTRRAVLATCALGLAACASLLAPRSIEIDQARIEQAIAKRFPFETRWLGAFDISASAPRLRLLPETNRVAFDLELRAGERVFARPVRGAMSLEGGLRFEPSDASLRLADVRVDRFALEGLPDTMGTQTGRLGTLIAEQLLNNMPLYTLSDDHQARLRSAGVQPGMVRVTQNGLSIALETASR